MNAQYLHPNPTCPVPLPADFWKEVMEKNNGIKFTPSSSEGTTGLECQNVASEVNKVMRENKGFIDAAIVRQVLVILFK